MWVDVRDYDNDISNKWRAWSFCLQTIHSSKRWIEIESNKMYIHRFTSSDHMNHIQSNLTCLAFNACNIFFAQDTMFFRIGHKCTCNTNFSVGAGNKLINFAHKFLLNNLCTRTTVTLRRVDDTFLRKCYVTITKIIFFKSYLNNRWNQEEREDIYRLYKTVILF